MSQCLKIAQRFSFDKNSQLLVYTTNRVIFIQQSLRSESVAKCYFQKWPKILAGIESLSFLYQLVFRHLQKSYSKWRTGAKLVFDSRWISTEIKVWLITFFYCFPSQVLFRIWAPKTKNKTYLFLAFDGHRPSRVAFGAPRDEPRPIGIGHTPHRIHFQGSKPKN